MNEKTGSEVLAMLGYEVQQVEQAIALRFTYGKATDAEDGPTLETPILFLLSDEARQLAHDLLQIAERIEKTGRVEAPPRIQ